MNLSRFAALIAVLGLGVEPAAAAYLIEIDTDGLDDGTVTLNPDFAFGGATTTANQSAAATAVGLTGGDSIFGGTGAPPDTYVYTHAPDSQPDNQYFDAGTPLGNGNFASGVAGGGPGRYAVYATWPASSNVGGGLTNYLVETAGDSSSTSLDQNGPGGLGSPDLFGNVWVKVGEVDYTSGPIAVTQTAGADHYVSMRAAGVLFERIDGGSGGGYDGPPGTVFFGQGEAQSFGIAFLRNRTAAQDTHFAVVESTDMIEWRTTDLKLVSVTDHDADHELVAFRSMTPAATLDRQFLAVRATPKMPLGTPPRYVAITYDDGPHPDRTPRLLDILAERNIRATFYVTGINAQRHPQVLRRMINEGHEIGNHSFSHTDLTTLTDAEASAEMADCRDAVVAAATVPPATMRPPYGATNKRLRDLFAAEFGYPTVLWDVDPRDWDTAVGDQQVIDTILTESDHGEIILTHDIHERTISVMPTVLDGLLAQGFAFVTVTELLDLRGN